MNYEFERLFGIPLSIGKWFPYNSYVMKDKIAIQRKNLFSTDLYNINDFNDIKFVPTDIIKSYNDDLMSIHNKVLITGTEEALVNEAFHTAKIEGSEATLTRAHELYRGAAIDSNNRKSEIMVLNGFKAAKYLDTTGNKLDKDILLQVWTMIVEGCCENECIRGEEYRTGPVYVGNHQGLDDTLINGYMEKFLEFYNSDKYDEVPFIKVTLLHYMFETIHPFCDGNGRLGRLLINNYLIDRGYECCRAVSFSKSISDLRPAYYVAFGDSKNIYNDCTPFLEYMLKIFDETLHGVL